MVTKAEPVVDKGGAWFVSHTPRPLTAPFLAGMSGCAAKPAMTLLDPSKYHARDDWPQQSLDRIHEAAALNCGVLFSITPQECSVCMEKTTEMFPCKGGHHYCVNCRRQEQTADDEQCPCCRQQYIPSMYDVKHGGSSNGQDPAWYDQLFYWYHNPKVLQLAKVDPDNEEQMAQLSEHDQEMTRHIRALTRNGTDFTRLQGLSDAILKPNDVSSGAGPGKLCYCPDANSKEESCTCSLITHNDEWRFSCHLVQVCEQNSQQFYCPDKSSDTVKVRRENANLRSRLRVEKALQAERELKECLRTGGAKFAASQDQAVELAFNEMRNAIYGWLTFYNSMFRRLGPEDAAKLNEKLQVGIIHPMEHTILLPSEGMPGGAMRNADNRMTREMSGYEVKPVEWAPIVKQMVKDLKAGKATWRQDGHKLPHWWIHHGGSGGRLTSHGNTRARLGKLADAVRSGRMTQAEADGRPTVLDVWTATTKDEPLASHQLYEEECKAVEKLVEELDVDSPEKRAAARFGNGPAVIIDLLRKRREFMIEAEGMIPDGTRRWVNASFKELNHPQYQNTFAELVLHLGEKSEDGRVKWRVVRRENLSSWVMPAGLGEGEEGAEQVALNIHPTTALGEAA